MNKDLLTEHLREHNINKDNLKNILTDLLREYIKISAYETKENQSIPYVQYLDSKKYIDFIINQLNKIKENEFIANEFVRLFHYKNIWRSTIADISEILDKNSFISTYEEKLLCKLFKNKKTIRILAYLYNLDYVYCEREKVVFSLSDEKYIEDNSNYNKHKTNMTEKEYYRFYYGNISPSKNALKQKIKRAVIHLIDNEPELLNYLGIEIDKNGNMDYFRYSKTQSIQATYYDLIKQIQQFFNTSTIKPLTLDEDINKIKTKRHKATRKNTK